VDFSPVSSLDRLNEGVICDSYHPFLSLIRQRMIDPISERNVGMLSVRVIVKGFKITKNNRL